MGIQWKDGRYGPSLDRRLSEVYRTINKSFKWGYLERRKHRLFSISSVGCWHFSQKNDQQLRRFWNLSGWLNGCYLTWRVAGTVNNLSVPGLISTKIYSILYVPYSNPSHASRSRSQSNQTHKRFPSRFSDIYYVVNLRNIWNQLRDFTFKNQERSNEELFHPFHCICCIDWHWYCLESY